MESWRANLGERHIRRFRQIYGKSTGLIRHQVLNLHSRAFAPFQKLARPLDKKSKLL